MIRRGVATEAEEIARLHLKTALHAYAHIFPIEATAPTLEDETTRWSGWLDDDDRRVLVAADRDKITGVVLAGPDPVDVERGHLSRLYVDPPLWGRGTGRALYDASVETLIAQGFTTITLWVLEKNERARAWYERLGWQPTGERKSVFAPAGIDDVRYELTL